MADEQIRRLLIGLLPRLRRFGVALTGSKTDAEDLVQSTCERVLLRSEQLEDHTRIEAWLFGIMRNLWISELRKRRVRRHDSVDAADHVVGDDGPAVMEGRTTLAGVRQAMNGMQEEQRAVLMLVCVEGLSYKETAAVMDIPLGTVMSRLSRARLELHKRMGAAPAEVTKLPVRRSSDTDHVRPAKVR